MKVALRLLLLIVISVKSIGSVTAQDEKELIAEAEKYFSSFVTKFYMEQEIMKLLPTKEDCHVVFKGTNADTVYQYILKIKENYQNSDNKEGGHPYKYCRVLIYSSNDTNNRRKVLFNPNLSMFQVEYLRERDSEYGLRYNFFIKIGSRWVFFPKIQRAFQNL